MKAFDVHCHLYDKSFDRDRDIVVARAKKILFGILNAGENPETNRKVLALEKKYPEFCFSAFGFHPMQIHKFSDEEIEAELKWIKKQKPAAISEIGLDFAVLSRENLDETAKMRQIKWFERFLQLADELKVPVIIHSRWATKHVVEILEKLKTKKAVLHAFSGTLKEAERALKLGCKISIGNTIAYAEQKQELVKHLPLDAFCLETDSPVLAPVKGERNEPANISLVVKEIARIKGIEEKEVIEAANKNIKELLGI